MSKILIMVILFLATLSVKSEESFWKEFSIKMYPTVGLGSQVMDGSSSLYGTVKAFPLQYGPKDIGMSFFGFGYSFNSKGQGASFSPMGLRANNLMVSMDIHANRSDSVGLSLNYYFPLDIP